MFVFVHIDLYVRFHLARMFTRHELCVYAQIQKDFDFRPIYFIPGSRPPELDYSLCASIDPSPTKRLARALSISHNSKTRASNPRTIQIDLLADLYKSSPSLTFRASPFPSSLLCGRASLLTVRLLLLHSALVDHKLVIKNPLRILNGLTPTIIMVTPIILQLPPAIIILWPPFSPLPQCSC